MGVRQRIAQFGGGAGSPLSALPQHFRPKSGGGAESAAENDADIDEYSDGGLTSSAMDDGGESTEPEHVERTMYFGQADEKPRSVHTESRGILAD